LLSEKLSQKGLYAGGKSHLGIFFRWFGSAMSQENIKAIDKKKAVGTDPWLKRGEIKPNVRGFKQLRKHVREMKMALIEDQGGIENMSAAKEILMNATIEAYGFILIAVAYCKDAGVIRPDMAEKDIIELQPVLGTQYLAFTNTIRQNLLALGLDKKRIEKVIKIEEIKKEFKEDKKKGK